jgi:hypothetical protein
MSPRQRRIRADFEKLKAEFGRHPYISIEYEGNGEETPERYFVSFNGIKGIKLAKESTPERKAVEIIEHHKMEIYLHIDYPRLKPQCYMLTEIFHPNFRMASPHDICIGDYWASGETITDIIYQVGEMIQYQNYNVTSPLNGIAAKWARENSDMLPIDNKNLYTAEPEVDLGADNPVDIELK